MTTGQYIKSLQDKDLAAFIAYVKPGETFGAAAKRWVAERQLNITFTD